MTTTQQTTIPTTAKVKADKARIDRLKEQLRSTPAEVDFERIKIMEEVYANTQGDQNIMRRAKFMATLLERKKLYIDDNLFVGSMASTVNGIYTYPEWNIDWMKDDKTVEISFYDWPGGGGNLNYPRIYNHGLAAMIKEVEERQAALEMRLSNASKLYFYEASLILMRSIVRLAHRYAELARDMAAKEKDATRKAELIAIAETCEWVPEHPARNLREAIQTHFFCHLCAELEQVGCGYSEAYLGQNLEPYYQRDKAAGLIGPEDATFMLENLFIKLNEIGYYFGEKVLLQNSADLGQSISLGGFTEEGEDATAEMDYLILDASNYLHLPQPPLSCIWTERMSGKFLEKVLDVIGTGIGMPQFVNGDVMVKRALHLFGDSKKGVTLEKARRTCIGACVGSYIPYETGHPVEGQPNLGKIMELTMAELKKALAANFEGEYEKVRKLCYEDAPKHGNDIPEMNRQIHRVYESILTAFNKVDGGGNYLSKDIKSVPDAYTKSIHNLMGMVTGALPNGKRAGVALTDGSMSAMPGTDVNGPTALVMSAAKSQDAIKYSATHMAPGVQNEVIERTLQSFDGQQC